MEISRDALLHVIRAERKAFECAETVRKLTLGGRGDVELDSVYGDLADALFEISGEVLRFDQDFSEAKIFRLLTGDLLDGAVADEIMAMAEQNADEIMAMAEENAGQPKPNTFSTEEMNELYRTNGGYMTPEGEWK